MLGILMTIFFAAIAAFAAWTYGIKPAVSRGTKKENNAVYIIALCAAAFLLRVILSAAYKGHDTDMNCFIGWAEAVFENGFSKFYTLDMFHDYPPGYMYVLYVAGAIIKPLGLSGGASYALIKFPAVICDIITGIIVYKTAKKNFSDELSALFAALYLFNPAVILNSSLWGQVDSVYTLFSLLMVYFITEKKMLYSYFMFAICLFIKPQAFIFTPVLIGGIIENVFREGFSIEKLLKNISAGAAAIVLIVLLALPFGIGNVIGQYKTTLSSYPHLTVNAFNIWGAMGGNWGDLTPFANALSFVFLAAITLYSLYIIIKSKGDGKYYFAAALLAFLTYMLSTKMHDRYAFPAIVFLLIAFVSAAELKGYLMFVLVSLSQFFNTAWVLFIYQTDINKYAFSKAITVYSIINIAISVFVIYVSYRLYIKNGFGSIEKVSQPVRKSSARPARTSVRITPSAHLPKITRVDVIAMAVITAVYAGIALYDLGDMHAPETEYNLADGAVTVDLGGAYDISEVKYFLGSYELNNDRAISLKTRGADGSEVYSDTVTSGSVFHWEEKELSGTVRYIDLSTTARELSIKEFAVIGANGSIIAPGGVSPESAGALFDEQDEVPERSTFRNGTYFDEIYHARTAYEFVHHLSVYEWTHPPLGKAFIALGILLFGMVPFGWRIIGTVFGIIMVPIIYMFAKKLLKKSWLAIITCLLFTFDFMHFAQTRIATIDVYVTFFIMLMYYFMYKYYSTSFYDNSFKKGLGMLALSGTAMGLGIASKWTGIYAGAGLAVLFCITLYRRYEEYRYALKNPNGVTDGISHKFIADNFKPYMIKTFAWCVIFFIIVPTIIYLLAYIPYLNAPDQHGLASILSNQGSMLTYHSKTVLNSTHAFSSRWYEWIIMKRPIWYYSGKLSEEIKEGISSFGNPLVWWMGIPAFFYMAYRTFKNRDKNSLFLVIAYLAQLVSWIPVTRLTFIYHYFPCVPFIVLMIGYSIKCIYDEAKNKRLTLYCIMGYTALVIVLFIMFYPVLSGQAVNVNYVNHFLKWFNSWVLI